MSLPPTKAEILAKYRTVIDAEDFEILCTESMPLPGDIQRERASLQYLGTLGSWYVCLKRKLGQVVQVIVFMGGLASGVEAIVKYGTPIYDEIGPYVQRTSLDDRPATGYVVFDPPREWPLPPRQSHQNGRTLRRST